MQVSVEKTGDVERKVTFEIAADKVQAAVETRMKELTKTVRLNGFRPGKVPVSVIRKRFGQGVRQEVIGEQIEESYREAVTSESLRTVGSPQIDDISDNNDDSPIVVTARVEVYPDIVLADFSTQTVKKIEGDVTDADVDEMIDSLRKQRRQWESVDRTAKDGDQVTVDFEGKIENDDFDGGKAEDFNIVIGSGQLIEGFESGLIGVKAGDDKVLDLRFPDDYRATEVAGKDVKFSISVKEVSEPKDPEVDAELAKAFGVESGDLDEFRAEVRNNMQRELAEKVRSELRNSVMQMLESAHDFKVPAQMIEQEITQLQSAAADQAMRSGAGKGLNLPREVFEKQAQTRVVLGMVLANIAESKDLKPDEDRISKRLDELAASYEKPQDVIDYYNGNEQAMDGLRASVFEDQVVDWVVDQANVETESKAFSEIVTPEGQ